MSMEQYRQVMDPDKLAALGGLFDSTPKAIEPEAPRTPVQKQEDASAAYNAVVTSRVTNEETVSRLQKSFSKEVKGGREQLLLEVTKPEVDMPTWADWVSPALSISSSLAAGIPAARAGAAAGAAFPPYGPAVGATLFGMAATLPLVFGSEYAGNAVEDLAEGRKFDPDRAFQEAIDAAQTDAIIQIALPVIGTAVKSGVTLAKRVYTGKVGLTDDAIDTVANFQQKLKDFDSEATLLPVMASRGSNTYMTQIAQVSQLSKRTVERLLSTYDKYMGAQINDVMVQFRGATPTEQGEALRTFIQQADLAIDDIVDPIYRNIDQAGKGVIINPQAAGMALAKKVTQEFRGKTVRNPQTGLQTMTPAYPTGAVSSAVSDLKNLPNDLTFFEAHKRLSKVKGRLYNAQNTSANKDLDLINVLADTADMYKQVMMETADTLSPALKKEYEDVTRFYSESKGVVSLSFLDKALNVSDPSQVGALITKTGFELPVKQIKELKKLAAQLSSKLPKGSTVTGLKTDPLEGIRRGYLEELFKLGGEGGQPSLVAFQNKLKEPKFKATFDELFKGTPVPAKIDVLLKELDILANVNKLGGGMQLQVASAEYGAVKGANPNILKTLRDLAPSFMANRAIKQKSVDNYISMVKAATEAEKRGVKLSPSYALQLNNLLGIVKVGQGLGAASGTME
tara:strand:- start:47 stop:2089 length:2043 start_codon:yes stop_codon:yes gene_type:complete